MSLLARISSNVQYILFDLLKEHIRIFSISERQTSLPISNFLPINNDNYKNTAIWIRIGNVTVEVPRYFVLKTSPGVAFFFCRWIELLSWHTKIKGGVPNFFEVILWLILANVELFGERGLCW